MEKMTRIVVQHFPAVACIYMCMSVVIIAVDNRIAKRKDICTISAVVQL